MIKKLIASCLILFIFSLSFVQAAPSLKEKFCQGHKGDFIVTLQEGHYSLLMIRSLNPSTLLLEEISVPASQIDIKQINWKKWVVEKAPGHTSWTLYEINCRSGDLIECFSVSKNGWLRLDKSEQILPRLLTLPLSFVTSDERKKVGAANLEELDQRSLWNPPLIINGQKRSKAEFTVLKATWPDDGSPLSSSLVELYFAKELPHFPFPFWVEVKSAHYAFKMRTVDSGQDLISPIPGSMPHRPPQIIGAIQKGNSLWKLSLKVPSYYSSIQLKALDIATNTLIPLTSYLVKGKCGEEMTLEVPYAQLQSLLKSAHKYQFVLIPQLETEDQTDLAIGTEEFLFEI